MTLTALGYNQLMIEAIRLGRRMRILHKQVECDLGFVLDDLYDGRLDELADRLFGIAFVLDLLRVTPNAFINSEGMAALQDEVQQAAKIDNSLWDEELFAEAGDTTL